MNQEFNNQDNQTQTRNRFIFSDDFYDQLDKIPEEKPVSFDSPQIPVMNETISQDIPTDNNLISSSNIINPVNEDSNLINKEMSSTNQEEKIEMPSFQFIDSKPVQDNTMTSSFSNPSQDNSTTDNQVVTSINDSSFISKSNENIESTIPSFSSSSTLESNNEKRNQSFSNNVIDSTIEKKEDITSPVNVEKIEKELDNLNVDSGIDTALEQEILKSQAQVENKIPVVENNSYLEKPKERMVYRAKRNAPATPPIWAQFQEKQENEPQKQVTSVNESIPSQDNVSQLIVAKQPPIINIDEELEKEDKIKLDEKEEDTKYDEDLSNLPVVKSKLLEELRENAIKTGNISILASYGDDFCSKDYITNPAIGRTEEIKQLILILLTVEKSAILVGKPGIGKTSIVEGLAYLLERNHVPDALKGYRIISIKTASLLGTLPTGETRLQTLVNEIKKLDKVILFIDEIHMLMGATNESSLDFANMFKESLGRGSIKMIGATTNDEYERYILRDKAFVRRFQRIDVLEPNKEQTVKILMGTLPKIEKNTGAKLKYSNYIQSEIMSFIVDITSEYKRVYGIGSRYPDICLTLLSQAFSQAVFDNRKEVNILDIRNAIENSKNIYPDVIRKELVNFDKKFKELIEENTSSI
ncbi:ATP-dependent Clp protease ATP-binding subunit [bacterium]|nr:ATP-dependent Clp protease ATP-binding subunit [bacterium]